MKYTLKRTKRRTIALQIDKGGDLIVRAPIRASQNLIDAFIVEKKDWIEKHIKRAKERALQKPIFYFRDGEEHLYLGKYFEIQTAIELSKPLIFDDGFYFDPGIKMSKRGEAMKRWYRMQAKKYARDRLDYFAEKMNVRFLSFRLSNAKTYWGVCNGKKAIGISWRLIMAPEFVFDAIIVHELAHLRYRNHGKDFWSFVEQYSPDHKLASEWLKEYQERLNCM